MAGYAARNMGEEEYAVMSVRFSRKLLVLRIILAVLEYGLFCKAGGWIQAVSVIAAVLLVLRPTVDFLNRELTVTNARVLGRCGFFSMKAVRFPYTDLAYVKADKSFGGRLFGFGRVTLTTEGGAKAVFDGIPDAEAVKSKIIEMKEREMKTTEPLV